jgi:hypothetical protein
MFGIAVAIVVVTGAAVLLAATRQPSAIGREAHSPAALAYAMAGIERCLPEAARPYWQGTTVPPVAAHVFVSLIEAIGTRSGPDSLSDYMNQVVAPMMEGWGEPDIAMFAGLMENGLVSEATRACVVSNALSNPPV